MPQNTVTCVTVIWNAVVGATKYEVYRATAGEGTYTKVTEAASTSYTNTGLATGATYYYKVRAYRLVGSTRVYGGYSSIVSVKPVY
jgi:fibronectin type 3 domain-containing protein